jgi:cell division protein FtsI/penicillin-binding protein 2
MPPASEVHAAQAARIQSWTKLGIGGIMVALALLLGRVAYLKVIDNPRLDDAVGSTASSRPQMAKRGDLIDRRGRVIATSCGGYRLYIDPAEVEDLSTIAVDLAQLIGGDPVDYDKAIAPRLHTRYVVVNDLLEDWQAEAIRQARLPGVALESRLVRMYPQGELAVGIVGMVGFEHGGLGGYELSFDSRLAPEHGNLSYLRDARRRPLWIESSDYHPGRDGDDIQLSIDLIIQELAERRLRKGVKEFNAGGGRAIVLDCQTGEILAMCDYLNGRRSRDIVTDPNREKHPALGRNRCATDPYEPGSTFKPFIWSIATELGKAKPGEVIATPADGPHITSYGRAIRDVKYYGPVSWRTVLVKSLNSGMSIIAERMSHKEMQNALVRFGFGSRTNCGFPGETAGLVTSARHWSKYTQVSVSFGHEIAITPLQMVRAFAAFARDGTLPALRLTAMEQDDDRYRIITRAVSPEIALLTRGAMKDVMTDGTGRAAQSTKYQMFGKSGTAQLPKPKGKGKGYYEDRYVSSFIAGAPFSDPRIVVLVVIDDPDRSREHLGGLVGGPIVRDIIDQTLEYLGVPPELEQAESDPTLVRAD